MRLSTSRLSLAGAVTLVVTLGATTSALAATIPTDLEARANELRRQASSEVLSWVHEQGVALARSQGPPDLGMLERTIRAQFIRTGTPAGAQNSRIGAPSYTVLGNLNGADIEALAFIVLMEAAKSAQEDLKSIMAGVKAINNAKAQQRSTMNELQKMSSANAASTSPTPTPAPDRVAELVAAARRFEAHGRAVNLSLIARR